MILVGPVWCGAGWFNDSLDSNNPQHVGVRWQGTGRVGSAGVAMDVAQRSDGGGGAGVGLHVGVAVFDIGGAGVEVDVRCGATAGAGDGAASEELVITVEVAQGLAVERTGDVADGLAVALYEIGRQGRDAGQRLVPGDNCADWYRAKGVDDVR